MKAVSELENSSELLWKMQEWWRHAGKDAKKYFIEKLINDNAPIDWRKPRCSVGRNPDLSYVVDFKNDWYKLGDKLVYVYTDDKGMPFYVGMGNIDRPINLNSRSRAFLNEFRRHEYCKVYIIATNVCEVCANDIETLCIWYLMSKGWKLVNVQKTRPNEQHRNDLEDEYPHVMGVLKIFNSDRLQEVLNEAKASDKCVIRRTVSKEERYGSLNVWEIDGVIKSAHQWAEEYGEYATMALQRIVKYGCTPKEALTFPKQKTGAYKNSKEFWESQGLFPGTDTTSRVISTSKTYESKGNIT